MGKKPQPSDLDLLGKLVKVIMDRPMYSFHPDFGFEYKVNYGFIPGTLADDGSEVDAYVLGVTVPIKEFEGIVKAVIIRNDDNENKLIVTKPDYRITKEEIRSKTWFQERYFDTEIVLAH